MKRTSHWFGLVGCVLFMLFSAPSCVKDDAVSGEDGAQYGRASVDFVTDVIDMEGALDTKSSVLTASDVETKLSGITLAFYESGRLVSAMHYTSSFSAMRASLVNGSTYNIYALANMGDMRTSFPDAESSVQSMSYAIDNYSSVNVNGIPMSGSRMGFVAGTTADKVIPLTRLLAKVTANITCTWPNPRISEVRVYNMNRILSPFGTSVASASGGMLSFQDYQTGSNASSFSAVLYVPENMQGDVPGIADSFHKTNDLGNATVSGRQSYLTYLQTKVSSSSTYNGEVYYRSYLGSNATTNFDIRRNTHYVWNLTYDETGLQYNDWKHDTDDMGGTRYRYALSPASQTLDVGETESWQVMRYTDTYAGGTWTNGTVPAAMPRTEYSYDVEDPSVASVAPKDDNTYATTGVAKGSTKINVAVSGYNLSLPVTVNDVVTYELEVTGSSSASVGETIALTATYYKVTNGVRDSGQDVTNSASWSRTAGASTISVDNASPNKGRVTATAGGTATITASYNGVGGAVSGSMDVTFGNVEEDRYRLVITPASSTIAWNATETYTVNRYTDHYTNGSRVTTGTAATAMPASSFDWTSSSASVATVAAGVATGKGTGTATITATLKSSVAEYAKYPVKSVSASLTVNAVVNHRLVLSADSTSKPYDGTINLTAKYYTTTNGVEDGGTVVTPASLTKVSGGSNITLTAGNPSTAKLTNPSLSVVANNKADVKAVYAGIESNVVSIEFTNGTTYGYTRLVVTGDGTVSVGSQTGNYTATLYTQTYVNGVASGAPSATDVSGSVTFLSSDTGVATVSGRRATGVGSGTTYISAKYDGPHGSITSSGSDRATLTVQNTYGFSASVSPATIKVGGSATASASRTLNGSSSTTGTVTWSSGTPGVASVNASTGAVKGVSAGTAVLTATWKVGGNTVATATCSVTVEANVYVLAITPATASVNVGADRTFSVSTRTKDGANSSEGTIEWSSSSACATVNTSGVVHGVSAGTATITATWKVGGNTVATATGTVTVQDVISHRLAVTPATSSANVGETVALTAKYYTTTNGSEDGGQDVTNSASWSRTAGASAISVNNASPNKGRVTATAGGTATISASYSGVSGSASVTFNDVLGLSVSPATTSVFVGAKVTLQASRTLNGAASTAGTLSWSSSNTGIATVNASSGEVSGVAPGTARITATWTLNGKTKTAYADVTVRANVYTLTISPASATKDVGQTQQFSVTAKKNGTTVSSPAITWSSSNAAVATVNTSGLATARARGTANITASWSPEGTPVTASAPMTVNDVVTHRMVITAVPSATANVGETITLKAIYYTTTNGVEDGGEDVSWLATWIRKSGASSVNALNGSNGCIVSATDGGTAVIEATYEGTSATKSVTFNDVYSLTLAATPSNATTTCDNTIVLTPTAKKNGVVMSSPTIVWSTGNANIARVSGGTVSCWNPGTATITAQLRVGSSTVASATKDVTFTGGSYYDYYAELLYGGTNPYSNPNVLEMMAAGGNRPSYAGFKLHRRNWTFANGSWSNVDTVLGCDEYNAVQNPGLLSSVTKVPSLNYWQAVSRYNGSGTCTITCTVISDGQTVDIPVKVYPMEGASSTYRELILTADGSSVASSQVGGAPIQLRVIMRTTNYVDNVVVGTPTTVDVTSLVSWLPQPLPAGLTIASNGNATSTAVLNNVEVYAYYPAQALNSNRVKLTFTAAAQTITYVHRRLVVEGPSTVQVGSTTGDYTATLYDEKVVNGVPTGEIITVDVSNQSTIFYSEDIGIATVSGRKATGVAAGSTKIYATYNDTYGGITSAQADRATLTVTTPGGPVTHTYELRIEPPTPSIESGQTQQFKAYLVIDGNVSEMVLLSSGVLWSSSATDVATIDNSGLATGVSAGTATITAKYTPAGSSQIQATATLTVTAGGGVIIDDGWD